MLKDEWIDIKEKEPNIGKVYLLYITYPPGTLINCRADAFPKQNIRLGGLNRKKKWISYENQYPKYQCEYVEFVSHWMELPEKPKEKENAKT